jgi:hypothetical protein
LDHNLDYAASALIILLITYVMVRMVIKAYFAAKMQFINSLIDKAKELARNGKTQQ